MPVLPQLGKPSTRPLTCGAQLHDSFLVFESPPPSSSEAYQIVSGNPRDLWHVLPSPPRSPLGAGHGGFYPHSSHEKRSS